ncbi:hypothetical protein AcW1_002864 [Taiwanofungus camphoratus]|nr:hypothetical protein AcW1_002864 [Antrodia cinnamomea]
MAGRSDIHGFGSSSSPHPGYETFTSHLTTLLTTYPPHFIFVYDSEAPRITSSVVCSILSTISNPQDTYEQSLHISYACVNAVACFTPRLFYDTVLNTLAGWRPTWDDGCENWSAPEIEGERLNESMDTFLHGLRAVRSHIQTISNGQGSSSSQASAKSKGKGRAKATDLDEEETYRLVLVVERAERLKETLPDLLVPLTRLAELSRVDIVTIFISDVRWEDIRPPLGASPEPFYMDIPVPSKQVILDTLASSFSSAVASSSHNSIVDANAYHPALRPLYSHFLTTLYSICAPFTREPHELAYIAAARWPGFVQPVLDDHRRRVEAFHARRNAHAVDGHGGWLADVALDGEALDGEDGATQEENGIHNGEDDQETPPKLVPPAEDTRIRLTRLFTPSFTAALEELYPRLTNAADWARAHAPPRDLLAIPLMQVPAAFQHSAGFGAGADAVSGRDIDDLPRLPKFVLVAAFLASTNPSKSDLRMFGRGPDERTKRRRRKGGSPRKLKAGTGTGSVKIPQRLLGPTSFPLDRLLAILGVLLEENDVEMRPPAPQYTLPGEYTDMEISRVAIYAEIMELVSMRLLLRTSPADKLDTSPTFKCGISYEVALRLARDVGVLLNDLMWEPA